MLAKIVTFLRLHVIVTFLSLQYSISFYKITMIVTFYKITCVIIYLAPNAGNEFQLPPYWFTFISP